MAKLAVTFYRTTAPPTFVSLRLQRARQFLGDQLTYFRHVRFDCREVVLAYHDDSACEVTISLRTQPVKSQSVYEHNL